MNEITKFVKGTLRRWTSAPRTSAMGITAIVGGILVIARNTAIFDDPTHLSAPLTAILTGIGLLYSDDASSKPKPPEDQTKKPWE